jgi:DNA-binding response OmpR family regulator
MADAGNNVVTGERARLLVVDDDAAIRRLIASRLSHLGHEVVEANDGEEALDCVANDDDGIDLVLLDVMMPGLDGHEVLTALRENHDSASLPVIMVTARDKGEDVVQALHLGANDYIIKPVDFQLLAQRVEVHLKLKSGRDKTIGPYRIVERIGAGGMGVVYSAQEVTGGRRVALKVLPRAMTIDEVFVDRFVREARLAARVNHPNVVPIYDTGKEDETYFIAMELVEGHNLGQLCEGKPASPAWALRVARQVAAALEAMRSAGILHRDIKPENVIVASDDTVKITDFGIARDVASITRMTDTGVGVGSVIYASPEQIRGSGDFRSDIYSLGCTLFFMLAGVDPFPADRSIETVVRRKAARPPRTREFPPGTPRSVRKLIARMLEPRPSRRFQSYDELRSAIEAVIDGAPDRWLHRRQVWIAAGVAAALAVAGVVVWRLAGRG